MISFIKGKIIDMYSDRIILESNNMGYEIFVTSNFMSGIQNNKDDVKIYTYLNVKEDSLSLFGFNSREEQNIFKQLITVSGIGPKGALAILSTLTVEELKIAVISDDSKAISKSPGIGAKTASKLIIELKDKLDIEDIFSPQNELSTGNINISSDIQSDATQALVSLGYSPSQALSAIKSIDITEGTSVEEIIKMALKKLI